MPDHRSPHPDLHISLFDALGADGVRLFKQADERVTAVLGEERHVRYNPKEGTLSWSVSPSGERDRPAREDGIIIKNETYSLLISFHGEDRAVGVFVPTENLDPYGFLIGLSVPAHPEMADSPSAVSCNIEQLAQAMEALGPLPEPANNHWTAKLTHYAKTAPLSPLVSFPAESDLPSGQRLLTSQIVESGEELLEAVRNGQDSLQAAKSKDPILALLDEVHITYALALENEKISPERCELLGEALSELKRLLSDENQYELDIRLEKLETELLITYAKGLSVFLGEDVAVVQSEDSDATWNDFLAVLVSECPVERKIQFIIRCPEHARFERTRSPK